MEYEMGFNKAMLVLILPREVDVSDGAAVECAIEGIDESRIYLTGGSVGPQEDLGNRP